MKRIVMMFAGLCLGWLVLAFGNPLPAASGGPLPALDRQKHARVKTATFASG